MYPLETLSLIHISRLSLILNGPPLGPGRLDVHVHSIAIGNVVQGAWPRVFPLNGLNGGGNAGNGKARHRGHCLGIRDTFDDVSQSSLALQVGVAPYKYPRIIEYVDELPRTVNGKIRRATIREQDKTHHASQKTPEGLI